MKSKERGFTLVELLAVIVILGIIAIVAVPNVVGILERNRASIYVEDAKKMVTNAEYKLRGNNIGIVKPTNGKCIIMNLAYLDNTEFDEAPNGGEYLKDESYVVIKRNNNQYEYFVQLVEGNVESTNSKGIALINSKKLFEDTATNSVDLVPNSKLFNVSNYAFIKGENNTSKANSILSKINNSVSNCQEISYVYAIN